MSSIPGLQTSSNLQDDSIGYVSHAHYFFGWKGDAVQRAMDSPCYVNCPTLKTQTIATGNKCAKPQVVDDLLNSCEIPFYLFWGCEVREREC